MGISGPDESQNNYSTSLRRAIEYWRGADHPDLAYPPQFTFDPDADDPHVVVQFTPKITHCGQDAEGALGCAPVLTNSTRAFHPEVVQVQLGLTNESTYRVVRHELGHLLGIEHGEGPGDIMSPTGIVHERVVRISLAFETSAAGVQRDSRRQVRHALEYYAGGADGFLEEDVAFAIIENASAADVIVRFEESGRGSTGSGTHERYEISVEGVDVDRRGWHVGYWLGFYLGASSQEALPPPFDEPDADRRERWW